VTNSSTCINGSTQATVTAMGSGTWISSTRQYQFLNGCYAFILADHAKDAFDILANPTKGTHPSSIVHATAPFNSSTEFVPGACPA
jgi:hypothetical protein